jgi:hypothetical protein
VTFAKCGIKCGIFQSLKPEAIENTWAIAASLVPCVGVTLNKNSLQLLPMVVYLLVYLITDSQRI